MIRALNQSKPHIRPLDMIQQPQRRLGADAGQIHHADFRDHDTLYLYHNRIDAIGDKLQTEEKLPEVAGPIEENLPLSVCLLGMGADMHTASIFPGADRLNDALTGTDTLYPMRAPGAPEPRITLSAHVLNNAMRRHILIIGQEKREALEKARHLSPQEAPVASILQGTTVHWADK